MSEALFAAVRSGDVDALRALLADDPELASAQEDGVSAVLVALYHRQDAARAELLAAGARIGPLEAAALGDPAKLDVNARGADGFTSLHLAAFFSGAATVRALLAAGADPNADAENPLRVRPLHSAVAAHDRESATALLEAGADPNVTQRGGFTPLHGAAHAGDAEMVALLLAHGADPSLTTDDGRDARALAEGAAAAALDG
ncbi:ankyrin repeat domain-containing protein [Candidatus Solirubrobacter pratensis]|uniref:ankyrin repeat domain-containing protein n=1 Tax=Candidatus Solirubrobacter pratensis TaxID=1298857 RepID=UPI00040869CB|nr:ankyrin repeat domain-containing protein [Candidatus Solirubrobacter pratensis]